MSVLVKGMDMPKTEEESKLLILTPDGVTLLSKLGTGNRTFDVEEVATPHGRLIDAESLGRNLQKRRTLAEKYFDSALYGVYEELYYEMVNMIHKEWTVVMGEMDDC